MPHINWHTVPGRKIYNTNIEPRGGHQGVLRNIPYHGAGTYHFGIDYNPHDRGHGIHFRGTPQVVAVDHHGGRHGMGVRHDQYDDSNSIEWSMAQQTPIAHFEVGFVTAETPHGSRQFHAWCLKR